MTTSRRAFLRGTLGAAAGLTTVGVLGAAARVAVSPVPSLHPAPVDDLARALYDALSARGRTEAFVDYDDPLRQYFNRGVAASGIDLFRLRRVERVLAVDLFHSALSDRGRTKLPQQMLMALLGMSYGRVLFCGSPHDGAYQVLLTSAHLGLRIGGASREGIAFGGTQVYGDQTGDGEVGIPGNVHRDQLLAGQAIFASLTPAEATRARSPVSPAQTTVSTQGPNGRFEGIPLADASRTTREKAREFLDLMLGQYAPEEAAAAWASIEATGGIEAFHAADYDLDHQGGRRYDGVASQIIRLESPSAVFHYRAEPHLHALLNVEADPAAALSVGPLVTTLDAPLAGTDVQRLFEQVMREETAEDGAWYPNRAVAGRLRAGPVREGDVYCLESWDNRLVVIDADRDDLSPDARDEILRANPGRTNAQRLRLVMPDGAAAFATEYGIARHDVVARVDVSLRRAAIDSLRSDGLA